MTIMRFIEAFIGTASKAPYDSFCSSGCFKREKRLIVVFDEVWVNEIILAHLIYNIK